MDKDLQDLVAAWLRNAELSPARRDELLARLRSDDGFRRDNLNLRAALLKLCNQ